MSAPTIQHRPHSVTTSNVMGDHCSHLHHIAPTTGGEGRHGLIKEDTEKVASFLLSLKHRSVTPEPSILENPQQHLGVTVEDYPADSTTRGRQNQHHHGEVACVDKTPAAMLESAGVDVKAHLSCSKLVLIKDRDLVPDALFVAMAQMRPCKLTQADRVGCYKAREIGFVGMCCIHCGGQPGFGRYYPNSVRSLAQTTTSQTILKHVGSKCRFCPPHIRFAVNELQRLQTAREGLSTGRPRYGSRKIFFQRVWARLHDRPLLEDDEQASFKTAPSLADDFSNLTPSDLESEIQSRSSTPPASDDEELVPAVKATIHSRVGVTHKNSKRPVATDGHAGKRPRILSS